MFTDRFGSADDPCLEASTELSTVMESAVMGSASSEASPEGTVLSEPTRDHVASCLRCQAEVARYRRLARVARQLAERGPDAPADLEQRILDLLDREDAGDLRRGPARTAATIGGLAAAAGVIVLATRQRRFARLAG